MNEAWDSVSTLESLLSVRVGSQEFAIDISVVREVRGWVEPTPLPEAPPHVEGMISLRSTVIPVINLGKRLGIQPGLAAKTSVVVVALVRERPVGIMVDAVCDLLKIPTDGLQPPPDVGDDPARRLIAGTIASGGRILSLISVENVIPEFAGGIQ